MSEDGLTYQLPDPPNPADEEDLRDRLREKDLQEAREYGDNDPSDPFENWDEDNGL